MSGKNTIASLIFTFFTGLFLCSCGNIKGPKFPHIVSPRVIVETPASPVSGNISISFQLIDREQESAGVALEYSTDAGQTFHTATLTNPAEATGLASDWHPGVTHTVQWDSVTDMIGLSGPADVCVRVAPSDASNPSGTADISSTFTVNNIAYNQAPTATVSTPAGIQSGNIQITYTLTDAEGDTCSIVVLYSTNGGTTYQATTMGPAGDGLTGLSASPAGISYTFLWNSRADSVALTAQQDNVKIRITPTDFKDGTAGETNSFSVDNRIFTDFSASPRSGEAPLLVSFTDASTAFSGITSWSWDFGDGGTSIVQHPDHTYTAAGSYTVSLTVTGPDGSDTITRTDYITVTELPVIDTFYVATTGNDTTGDGTIDSPYATIQKGLDSASNGTTVIVFDGTYTGTGNKDLDFNGKAIDLKSSGGAANCIIDCQNSGRGFYFQSGETNSAIVEGFTIQNARITGANGAGMLLLNSSSPTIRNCTIKNCEVVRSSGSTGLGGALYCEQSSPLITDCTITSNNATYCAGGMFIYNNSNPTITSCIITNNTADGDSGGIYCQANSSALITNCVIANNTCGSGGGGISCYDASPAVINCTVAYNTANRGGAIQSSGNSSPTLNNCILWDNNANTSGNEIYTYHGSSSITLNYCDYDNGSGDVEGPGAEIFNNCITLDPQFVNATAQDYHLQAGSPCIDAGNNSYVSGITTDLDGNPRIIDGIVDIGAYEFVFLEYTANTFDTSSSIDDNNEKVIVESGTAKLAPEGDVFGESFDTSLWTEVEGSDLHSEWAGKGTSSFTETGGELCVNDGGGNTWMIGARRDVIYGDADIVTEISDTDQKTGVPYAAATHLYLWCSYGNLVYMYYLCRGEYTRIIAKKRINGNLTTLYASGDLGNQARIRLRIRRRKSDNTFWMYYATWDVGTNSWNDWVQVWSGVVNHAGFLDTSHMLYPILVANVEGSTTDIFEPKFNLYSENTSIIPAQHLWSDSPEFNIIDTGAGSPDYAYDAGTGEVWEFTGASCGITEPGTSSVLFKVGYSDTGNDGDVTWVDATWQVIAQVDTNAAAGNYDGHQYIHVKAQFNSGGTDQPSLSSFTLTGRKVTP